MPCARANTHQLLEKEKQYEAEGKDLTDVHSDIEVQQDIIEELNLKIDVYNLVPEKYGWRGLTSFEFISNNPTAPNGHVYAAAIWDEVDKACREVLDEHLQSPRQYFREDFLRNYIDEQEVASYFESFYEDDIRESPESYFDDSDYELTDEQEKMIDSLQKQIDDLENTTQNLSNAPIRWGLTGTVPKQPFEFQSIFASIGQVVGGIKAHELQEIYPNLVTGEKDGEEIQSINYNGLIGALIEAVKELSIEVQELKSQLNK